jgi:transcriptional regulator NrdR family protein
MNQPMKRPVTEDAPRGLVCRTCGCRHFRVLYTRRAWGGRLLRRRVCRHCGRRITTYEQPAGSLV